jgi:tetratricopeptide (TPR) repeat protein
VTSDEQVADSGALPSQLPEALARPDLGNLAVLLRYATQGCWAFAIYTHAQAREQVMAALRHLLQPLPVYEWTYTPDSPFPIGYRDRLSPRQRAERGVVFVFDLERADPGVWKSLDYNRELYAQHPHSFVFWISPQGRTQVPRMAPHFWSQRSGVFDFSLAPEHRPQFHAEALQQAREADIRIEDLSDIERQLRLYNGLLDDALADPQAAPNDLADLHHKVAELHYYTDHVALARAHAEQALALRQTQPDQQRGQADSHSLLGDLALREDDLKSARAHYEAALPVYQTIGDRLGEANTRQALGDLALREDDLETAQALVEQALRMFTEIGAQLSQAGSYHLLGRITDDATWFEKALALHTKIDSTHDIAVDKFYYAHLKLKQNDAVAAAEMFADARDIWQQMGLTASAQEAERQRQLAEVRQAQSAPVSPPDWVKERAERRRLKRAKEREGLVSRIFRVLGRNTGKPPDP